MEILMFILRVSYILNMATVLLLLVIKIMVHRKLSNVELYYSEWIFGTSLFISVLLNITFFMSDIIADSWHNLGVDSLVLLIIMNILNLFMTFVVFIGTKKRLDINSKSFIIYNMFSKRRIEFRDINAEKSEYVFALGKSSKFLPKKNIFGHQEYLHIYLNNGKDIKINLNPFLLSGNKVLLLTVVVKQLKIKRKTL